MADVAVEDSVAVGPSEKEADSAAHGTKKRRRNWRRIIGFTLLLIASAVLIVRAMLPTWVRWYVNRTLDRDPIYTGAIGDIDIALRKGQYSIHEVRINKTTGNIPVPLFSAKRIDLAVEWGALLEGRVVGRVFVEQPQLNFVDEDDAAGGDQTGVGGPWLGILRDLFPFDINSAQVNNGSVHFRAFGKDPPVDVYLNNLNAEVKNLRNVQDETKPLFSTITATATAMDSGQLDLDVKFDPFSYRPTFQAAVKLIGLDVTKTNSLARAYGAFDFEQGWFDLVVELDAKEGGVDGYIKPLFRNLKVLSLSKDLAEDNVLQVFWESLVGGTKNILKNQPRDQFGTLIPLTGRIDGPQVGVLPTLFNLLRNAFVRAYLPRLQGKAPEADSIQFKPGSVTAPDAPGTFNN